LLTHVPPQSVQKACCERGAPDGITVTGESPMNIGPQAAKWWVHCDIDSEN
jgi:hypothetical protein